MFCPKCGAACEDGAKFCPTCGNNMNGAPVQPAYQQPVYQQPVYQQPAQPVYQQPVYQQPVYQQPLVKPAVPGKGLGIASMVLGIVSLVMFCAWYLAIPCALVGCILGAVALNKAKQAGMKNGMGVAGLTCSLIALAILIIIVILGFAGLSCLESTVDDYYYYYY